MRHKKKFNHLGRKSQHRKAMLSNMASSLILHKRISTTLAKAKALRSYIEPLITKAKEDSTHSRRLVFSHLQNKEAVSELFREISRKVGDRPGGYTRVLKTGPRYGDNAEIAIIELVDYNEAMLEQKEEQKGKTTRRRRGGTKKKVSADNVKEQPLAEVKEEVKEEPVVEANEEVKEEPVAEVKEEVVKEDPKADTESEKKEE